MHRATVRKGIQSRKGQARRRAREEGPGDRRRAERGAGVRSGSASRATVRSLGLYFINSTECKGQCRAVFRRVWARPLTVLKQKKKERRKETLQKRSVAEVGRPEGRTQQGTGGGKGQGGGREMERSGWIGSVFVKEITRLAVWGEGEERVEDSPSSLL